METETIQHESTIEYPVSIDAIFNISFSVEGFKTLFNYIQTVLKRHESTIHSNSANSSSLSQEISKLREDLSNALASNKPDAPSTNTQKRHETPELESSEQRILAEISKIRQELEKNLEVSRSLEKASALHSSQIETQEKEQFLIKKQGDENKLALESIEDKIKDLYKEFSRKLDDVKSALRGLEESQNNMKNEQVVIQRTQKLTKGQIDDLDSLTQKLEAASYSHKGSIDKHDQSISEIFDRFSQFEETLSSLSRSVLLLKKDRDSMTGVYSKLAQEKLTNQVEKKGSGEGKEYQETPGFDSSIISKILESLNEVKNTVDEQDLRLANNESIAFKGKSLSEKNELAIRNLEKEIADIKYNLKQIQNLKKRQSGSFDMSELKSDMLKEDTNNLKNLIKGLEEALKYKVNLDEIENLKKQLKNLEEAMRRKATLDDLDAIRHSAATGQPIMTDIKAIRELQFRVDDLTRQFQDLSSQLHQKPTSENKQSDLSAKIEEISKQLSAVVNRLTEESDRINLLDLSINKKATKADIEELRKQINDLKLSKDDSFDSSRITALTKRVTVMEDHLKNLVLPEGQDLISIYNFMIKSQNDSKEAITKLEKIIRDILAKLKDFEDQLSKKALSEDLKSVEERFKVMVSQLTEDFLKRFAEKLETKRALKFLEKLIQERETVKEVQEGDDAMLAKKPLGGWSCASCQKDLEKLIGKIAPYYPWNRMPQRDPADRLARAGPGFSRMLASISSDNMISKSKKSLLGGSPPPLEDEEEHNTTSLPPIKKNERFMSTT